MLFAVWLVGQALVVPRKPPTRHALAAHDSWYVKKTKPAKKTPAKKIRKTPPRDPDVEALEAKLAKRFRKDQVEWEDDEEEAETRELPGWEKPARMEGFIVRRPQPKETVAKKMVKATQTESTLSSVESDVFDEVAEASFSDLGVPESVRELLAAKFDARGPTLVQQTLIPALTANFETREDLVVRAPTGSGKTLAFLLPAVLSLTNSTQPQVLVIAPSRELAAQIAKVAQALAPGRCVSLCGGANTKRQLEKLKSKPAIVVGTPGRVAELVFEKRALKLGSLSCCIVDEADVAARAPHVDDVDAIVEKLPARCFVVAASASADETANNDGLLARRARYATDISVAAPRNHPALAGRRVHARILDDKDPFDSLRRVLRATDPPVKGAVVFVSTARDAATVARKLVQINIPAIAISGQEDDVDRANALDGLRYQPKRKRSQVGSNDWTAPPVLVATELAARGIDCPLLSHVINYDSVPSSATHYAHRAGRCARKLNKADTGFVVSIAACRHARILDALARDLGITIHDVTPKNAALVLGPHSSPDDLGFETQARKSFANM